MSILLSAGLPAPESSYIATPREPFDATKAAGYFQPSPSNRELNSDRPLGVFTIAELGFGIGERFLSIAEAWFETKATASTHSNQQQTTENLHYIAVTDRPLEKRTLSEASSQQPQEFAHSAWLIAELLNQLPPKLRGWHRLHFEKDDVASKVTLDLIYEDPRRALGQLTGEIDNWHLENFQPDSAKTEQPTPTIMAVVADAIAKHSPQLRQCRVFGASVIQKPLTAELSRRGFQTQQQNDYLCVDNYPTTQKNQQKNRNESTSRSPKHIAIIGAGLAGSGAALALARQGCTISVFDASSSIAAGTSGNPIAALQGRYHRKSDHLGRWAQAGWLAADRELSWLAKNGISVDAERCGSLHLLESDEQSAALAEQLQLPLEVGEWLNAESAAEKLGGHCKQPALWQPGAMRVAPASLCRARLAAADATLCLGETVESMRYENGQWHIADHPTFDAVVLATGAETQTWLPWAGLQLARGQLTAISAPENQAPHCIVGYGGQLWPVHNGLRWFGSTANREPLHSKLRNEDHMTNINRLTAALGSRIEPFNEAVKPVTGSAGIRSKTVDHLPLIGAVPDASSDRHMRTIPGLFLTAGHGARGIANSAVAGELLAAQIVGGPLPMGNDMAAAVAPLRALQRWRKKQGLAPMEGAARKNPLEDGHIIQTLTLSRNET